MNAYTIPKEPTKRTMAKRLERLEAKRDREIERKKYKLDEYEYKGFTIKRTRIQRWEVWKNDVMLKWFITLHEMRKYVEWKNEKEK